MTAKSTAANARFIDNKLADAAEHVRAARAAYAEVINAIQTGENESEFKLPEIEDLLGASRILARSTVHAQLPWNGYAEAREKVQG